ncbi:MAG: N-acetylmuramic acid 6-phosphate etherase [Thermotaleaceae bacterium]
MDKNTLKTEERNPNTWNIDCLSTVEIMGRINEEDKKVAVAVEKEIPHIAQAVDLIVTKIRWGGRLIYIGAGSSGRMGVVDAAECPSTYGTDPSLVQALIAGGTEAIYLPRDGAEDLVQEAIEDLMEIGFNPKDVLLGIAASGNTPYVCKGIEYAKNMGAAVVALTCNPESKLSALADISIGPMVGPEVIMGSTRMKAGTAQKMILNMISTGTMIKLGKVYENLMVDVWATNEKLIERCKRMLMLAADVTEEEAKTLLEETQYRSKLALFMALTKLPKEKAEEILEHYDGQIRKALRQNI